MVECCFNAWTAREAAQGKYDGKCLWCSPARLGEVCANQRLRGLLASALAGLWNLDVEVYELAVARLPDFDGLDEVLRRADGLVADLVAGAARPEEGAALPCGGGADEEIAHEGDELGGVRLSLRAQCLCRGQNAAEVPVRRCRQKSDPGACVFSTARPGRPARTSGGSCAFCSVARMQVAMHNPMKLKNLKADLRKLLKKDPAIHAKALRRLRQGLPVKDYKKILTPTKCCLGAGDDMCIFNTSTPGAPARVSPSGSLCAWCDAVNLGQAQVAGKRGLASQLAFFKNHCPPAYAKAHNICQETFGGDYEATHFQMARGEQARRRAAGRRRQGQANWEEALKKRKLEMTSPAALEANRCKYRKQVLADQKKVENSFFPGKAARKERGRADAIPEDVDPPLAPASYSSLAKGFESWCERGSWAMCGRCNSLQPRPLHEIDLSGDPKVELPKCRICKAKRDYYVPQPDDVPAQLRGLSDAAVRALSPLDVDVGKETRSTDALGRWNGYRKKMKMITFLWSEQSVKKKIKALKGRSVRKQAKEAYQFLLENENSSYGRIHDMHKKFLQKHGEGATLRKRKRPYHFIQETGLECAVWPHLYWKTNMTETYEQWSDVRRRERRAAKRPGGAAEHARDNEKDSGADEPGGVEAEEEEEDGAGLVEDSSDEEEAPDEDGAGAGSQRSSVKRSYMAKCFSPLLGYGSTFELQQFVFDLNLWATLGAKKNLSLENVPMRIRMKNHPFSPLYWKQVHNGLVDLVRQVGLPKLFFTIAPWEHSFKYHEWLKDEMLKTLRTRMTLPVGETLHIVHVLMQAVKGFLAGNNQHTFGRADRQWKNHVFSSKDKAGKPTKVITFIRVEFQDGSRKEGTKRYEGSGRPHLHVLFFTEDMADMQLEHHLFATKPAEETALHGYVAGSQLDRRGADDAGTACWPVFDGEPGYHELLEKLQLKRKREDVDAGLRVYCADLMDALPCHQDWQMADGAELLLAYVSKYVSKFSDSSYDEWMNDQASADSVARRVCFEYHPYEPEMILQLFGAQFRQYDISTASGGIAAITAPHVGMERVPDCVVKYMACTWRSEGMSLLEWLRKTNDDGEIAGWIRA